MAAEKDNDYSRKYRDAEIKAFCDDLLDWAENAKDLHIIGWSRKQKKSRGWINWLAKTYPKFGEAKEDAMELLGRKLLNSSFFGEGNATVGLAYLPVYDKDFRDLLEWKAKINKPDLSLADTFSELKKAMADGTLNELIAQKDD